MKQSTFLIICLIVIWLMPAVNAHSATIQVRSETDVASATVSLGDVADIVDHDADNRCEQIRSVVICSAPPPAETLKLDASAIASALIASGIDLSNLYLAGSAQVLVRREYDAIPVEELRRAFVAHVVEQTGWPKDSFLARPPKNLGATPVPIGDRKIVVETYPNEEFRGSVSAQFHVFIEGELYCVLSHRFTIERYAEALVTTRKIPRGKPIMPADVEVVKLEQSRIAKDSFTQPAQAIGFLAVRTLTAGTVIIPELLTVAPIVRKGEFKPIIYSGDGFQILTRGCLLEDGATDDIVRVRLPSRKIVQAMVVDSKTLKLVR